jgi:CheY-like chemotaxis protein
VIVVVLNVDEILKIGTLSKFIPNDFNDARPKMGRILLVEDTDTIRSRVSQGLTDVGFDVEVAVDGLDGLKKLAEKKFHFDLIVSDIEMPRMNGIDFAKKVRTIGSLRSVPLIAFTAKSSPADVQEAKAAGYDSFLEKARSKYLPSLILETLSSNRRRSA